MILLSTLLAFAIPLAAGAVEFTAGTAIAVTGDSVKVGAVGHRPETLRLWGIEAPAMSAPDDIGLYARAALDDLLRQYGPNVECTLDSFDRNAAVCRAGSVDLGAAMLLTGWAVADRASMLAEVPGGDADRTRRAETYLDAEAAARRDRKGRWAKMPAQ
ncbi:MAG: thermonuclease family protein [Alphaproteobacteria bacterium]